MTKATKPAKAPAKVRPAFEPGRVVLVTGGAHKGKGAQVRGPLSDAGKYAVLIGGRIHKVDAENLGEYHGNA